MIPTILTGGNKSGKNLSFKESITLGFNRNIAISIYYLVNNAGSTFIDFFRLCCIFCICQDQYKQAGEISIYRLGRSACIF